MLFIIFLERVDNTYYFIITFLAHFEFEKSRRSVLIPSVNSVADVFFYKSGDKEIVKSSASERIKLAQIPVQRNRRVSIVALIDVLYKFRNTRLCLRQHNIYLFRVTMVYTLIHLLSIIILPRQAMYMRRSSNVPFLIYIYIVLYLSSFFNDNLCNIL